MNCFCYESSWPQPRNDQRGPIFVASRSTTTILCIPSKPRSLLSTKCARAHGLPFVSANTYSILFTPSYPVLPSNMFPLAANLCCGIWYTDPAIVHPRSAYDSLRALSDDVSHGACHTSRARMVITELGLQRTSTSAAQTYTCYPSLASMAGTSPPSSQHHFYSKKYTIPDPFS